MCKKNLTSQGYETQLSVRRSEFGPNSHVLHPQSENDVGTVGDELLQEVGQHRERVPQPVRVVPAGNRYFNQILTPVMKYQGGHGIVATSRASVRGTARRG